MNGALRIGAGWRATLRALAAFLPLVGPPGSAAGTTITRPSSSLYVSADDGLPGTSSQFSAPLSVPASETLQASNVGSRSTATYRLTDDGFEFTFDQVLALRSGADSDTFGSIYFSPSIDVDYAFSGAYASDAVDELRVGFEASIADVRRGPLFANHQISDATPEESFVLGELGGDFSSELYGSPTGRLIAGREYLLRFGAWLSAMETTPTAVARATGYLSLSFVPEPSTAVLFGLGLAWLGRRRARRRACGRIHPLARAPRF